MFSPIIVAKLEYCLEHISAIENYSKHISNCKDLIIKENGLYYDAILMRLQSLGEILKSISNKNPEVISKLNYIEISDLIKFRDYLSHHYEKLEEEIIFDIITNNIPELKKCIVISLENESN